MRGRVIAITLTFAGLAGVAAFLGWAIYRAGHFAGGWDGLAPVWPFVLGAAVLTGGTTAVFMWLAFFSARRGYDERAARPD